MGHPRIRRPVWFLPLLVEVAAGQGAPGPPPDHLALVGEARHLVATLGVQVWPGWTAERAPLLLRSSGWEYLWHHPAPPSEFLPGWFRGSRDTIWSRPAPDTSLLAAALPIGGTITAVISAPTEGDDPAEWVLAAAHELFHVHVGMRRQPNPFIGSYAGQDEVTFPFPFQDSVLNAAWRLEAEQVFQALTMDSLTARIQVRLLQSSRRIHAALLPDKGLLGYKALIEWKEGVARYAERELSRLASDTARYRPSDPFRDRFGEATYARAWSGRYRGQLMPIRFVGEGVRGRTMFYYLGMGKAYLLDRLAPSWKEDYFDHTIDALLTAGSAGS